MPHQRLRFLEQSLSRLLAASPIVGLFGHRQVGKTTLATKYAGEYVTFDSLHDLELCHSGPSSYISNRQAPFAIDECQLCPPLFPTIKEFVRTHPKPGQLLLTGSVRFTSRKAISESLTGRILSAELLPMCLREIRGEPFPKKIRLLLDDSVEAFGRVSKCQIKEAEFHRYLVFGGLPGICFQRTRGLRQSRFKDHIFTILSRDLRLIIETSLDTTALRNLLVALARRQGEPLNFSVLSRETRISRKTLTALLSAFEALFLIRWVSSTSTAGPVSYYFEDQGIASYLSGYQSGLMELRDLTRFIYANLRVFFYYDLNYPMQLFEYRTRGGAFVPLVFQTENCTLGVLPIIEPEPTRSAIQSAKSFLNSSDFHKKKRVVIAHCGVETKALSKDILSIPWTSLL